MKVYNSSSVYIVCASEKCGHYTTLSIVWHIRLYTKTEIASCSQGIPILLSFLSFGMFFVAGCFPVSKFGYKSRMVPKEDMERLGDWSEYSIKLLPCDTHLVNEK